MSETRVREGPLTVLLLKFLKDSNKYVCLAAYKQLGSFIHTLVGCQISEQLIASFCQMPSQDNEEVSTLKLKIFD